MCGSCPHDWNRTVRAPLSGTGFRTSDLHSSFGGRALSPCSSFCERIAPLCLTTKIPTSKSRPPHLRRGGHRQGGQPQRTPSFLSVRGWQARRHQNRCCARHASRSEMPPSHNERPIPALAADRPLEDCQPGGHDDSLAATAKTPTHKASPTGIDAQIMDRDAWERCRICQEAEQESLQGVLLVRLGVIACIHEGGVVLMIPLSTLGRTGGARQPSPALRCAPQHTNVNRTTPLP